MVQRPHEKGERQEPGRAAACLPAMPVERPRREQRGAAQEQHRRPGGQQKVVQPVDRYVRPRDRKHHQAQVRPPPTHPLRERQRRPQQRQRRPTRRHLVPEQPHARVAHQKAQDRDQPRRIQRPRQREVQKRRFAVPPPEQQADRRKRERHRRLQHGRRQLRVGRLRNAPLHGAKKATAALPNKIGRAERLRPLHDPCIV